MRPWLCKFYYFPCTSLPRDVHQATHERTEEPGPHSRTASASVKDALLQAARSEEISLVRQNSAREMLTQF